MRVDRQLLAMLLAGFSAGVPLFLVTRCLQAWFTEAGFSVASVSFASLIALPWSLKFLWAPLTDRLAPPGGRRRGWLLLLVLGLMLGVAGMSLQRPLGGAELLVLNAVLIALLSATQDVVVDAWRVEAFPGAAQQQGSTVYLFGYRAALIATGGGGMWLASDLGWPVIYLLMAGVQGVGLVAWWTMRETAAAPPQSFRDAVVEPMREYQGRRSQGLILAVFAFAILYKLGDSLAGNVTTVFLLRDGGFTQKDLALIQNTWGLLATLIGVGLGGLGMLRLGLNRSLWIFGVLQGASNLAYAGLAQWGGGTAALAAVVTIENLCAGLGTVAFVAFLSAECAPAYAATQFALLSSLMAAGRDGLASTAGVLKDSLQLGWPGFFLLTAVAALPGLLLLSVVAGWSTRPLADGRSSAP